MEFELYWKDYKRFGADGASHLLTCWLNDRIAGQYGPDIQRIFVCGHCRSLADSNENLRPTFDAFNKYLAKLRDKPDMIISSKKKELEICFATVWPTADEFQPDSAMLKLGTFTRLYMKLITLLTHAGERYAKNTTYDFAGLISEIKSLEPELPRTLDDLVLLYVKYMKGTSNKALNTMSQ